MTTKLGPDQKPRCSWALGAPEFLDYHDTEWGFPVVDDQRLFEKICLETFQSGLSWRTILNKRDNFRQAFADFDFRKVALFDEKDVERLLQDKGIVRNQAKIRAVINNAKRACELIETEGSIARFVWQYEPKPENQKPPQSQTTSDESKALAKDLKKRGWSFVGPTTAFAFMQAMGLINDHAEGCITRQTVEESHRTFSKPGEA